MFTPDNYKLHYRFEQEKKTFRQYELQTAEVPDLLPDLIRLEKNNGYNSITGADNLLRIRNNTNWSRCTLTGLRPTGTPNYYYSDLPVKGVKSLIVVFIPENTESVFLRVCRQFYPIGNATFRTQIVNEIIKNF